VCKWPCETQALVRPTPGPPTPPTECPSRPTLSAAAGVPSLVVEEEEVEATDPCTSGPGPSRASAAAPSASSAAAANAADVPAPAADAPNAADVPAPDAAASVAPASEHMPQRQGSDSGCSPAARWYRTWTAIGGATSIPLVRAAHATCCRRSHCTDRSNSTRTRTSQTLNQQLPTHLSQYPHLQRYDVEEAAQKWDGVQGACEARGIR
jgi:hypothetical protein